jgi:hypothetical protein
MGNTPSAASWKRKLLAAYVDLLLFLIIWGLTNFLVGGQAHFVGGLIVFVVIRLLTWGSGDMVRQLLAIGLVDELRLLIYPVVLGRGKRLFGDNAQVSAFTLAHSNSTPGGVLITRYVRSGEVRTGTFES